MNWTKFDKRIKSSYLPIYLMLLMWVAVISNHFFYNFFRTIIILDNLYWIIILINLLLMFIIFLFFFTSINFIKSMFYYFIFYVFIIVSSDMYLAYIGFGFPASDDSNCFRTPSPYDEFTGLPNECGHNRFGFKDNFVQTELLDKKTITVAIFGGSTAYNGDPTLPKIIEKEAKEKGLKLLTYNFASASSNHSQHVHRLVKFVDQFKFDFVIFYGGYNESIQNTIYDPRVGYPFNFYYASETPSLNKLLVQNSALFGSLERHMNYLTNLSSLRLKYMEGHQNYPDRISNRYERDLKLAKKISNNIGIPNFCSQTNFISITQPVNASGFMSEWVWGKMMKKSNELSKKSNLNHIDLSKFGIDRLPKKYYYKHNDNLKIQDQKLYFVDEVHLHEVSRQVVGKKILDDIWEILINCNLKK